MPYRVQPIENQQNWEDYIHSHKEANFLHSWNWGVFEQSLGKEVLRLGIFENETLSGVAQAVIEKAKRGTYMALAGGPIVDWHNENAVAFFFDGLRQAAREAGCLFIRFRPQELGSEIAPSVLKRIGAHLAPMHLTADLTLQLDLEKSSETLLSEMRKNTRSEIRKAERLGLRTTLSQDPADMKQFYEQQLAVAQKHHFVPFSYDFLEKQFATFAADDQAVLFSTYLEDTLLAQAFVLFYNGEAVYHYGVSTPDNQKLPGAYQGQWAAICEAQRRGCKTYNFWGVAPEEQKEHRFAGVSLFKRGFGGKEVAYLPAHDIPLSWLYWPTFWFEKLRHVSRKL